MDQTRKLQIIGILLIAFGLMYLVSLVGHRAADDQRITSDEAVYGNPFSITYVNPGGLMGAYLSYVAYFFMGWSAFFSALFLCVSGIKLIGLDIGRRLLKHAAMPWILAFMILMLFDITRVAGSLSVSVVPDGSGVIGQAIVGILLKLVGIVGSFIVLIAAIVSTVVLYASISHRFRNLLKVAKNVAHGIFAKTREKAGPLVSDLKTSISRKDRVVIKDDDFRQELKRASGEQEEGVVDSRGGEESDLPEQDAIFVDDDALTDLDGPVKGRRRITIPGRSEAKGDESDTPLFAEFAGADSKTFIPPTLDLMRKPDVIKGTYDEKELPETARALRETLETFGVRLEGNIEMYPGPVITRFEIRPAAGIKVNQIANLSEDLALNLRAKSIRIVAPIPGKAAVGVEIPNRHPQMVYVRDILASEQFQTTRNNLPLALGKDISGRPFVTGLAAMPHLLIAGTTGSGKSVCINVIITSLIFSRHPDELKFIFIDPKMLELSVYKGIPYLAEQVVTNPKQAERVLGDVVVEMEERYQKLAAASVRSIVDYNRKQKSASNKLPYIVIVIDELADLMMSSHSSRVELLITRLAQMARAVGIHLILATQRPSVDVITGLIKANFPSRIAFQVATKTDSRTILDANGAERLLGKGDMLFMESGLPEARRLHGALITSEETDALVAFLKTQPYSRRMEKESEAVADEKAQMRQLNDPVLLEAVETVVQQGQASVSLLQRKLGVGYQRAARIIDDLEAMKIIGPYNESKARDVLVDKSFVENLKSGKIGKL